MTNPHDLKGLVERLEELARGATPPPWRDIDGGHPISDRPAHIIVPREGRTPWYIADMQDDLEPVGGDPVSNAALMVELVNNLPAILTALRSYKTQAEEIAGLREALEQISKRATFPDYKMQGWMNVSLCREIARTALKGEKTDEDANAD